MESFPHQYYNFHPGAHTGQGAEKGIELIAEARAFQQTFWLMAVLFLVALLPAVLVRPNRAHRGIEVP